MPGNWLVWWGSEEQNTFKRWWKNTTVHSPNPDGTWGVFSDPERGLPWSPVPPGLLHTGGVAWCPGAGQRGGGGEWGLAL